MNKEEYIKKWLDDSLSEEEKAVFMQSEDYLFVDKLSRSLHSFKSPAFDARTHWEHLIEQKSKKTTKVIPIVSRIRWYQIAASVVLLVGIGFYLINDHFDDKALLAYQKTEQRLPDTSVVQLNTHSSLTYDDQNWETNRKAYLNGEGYFEVAKGARFDIESASGTVTVLGTAFNIKDRDGFYEVHCYHGRVKVKTNLGEVELTKNQTYRVLNGIEQRFEGNNDMTPSWTTGESSFESVPYIQVIKELQRQYPIELELQLSQTNLLFTGKFTHSNLNLALQSITTPLNVSFEIVDDHVRLFSASK